MSYQHRVGLTLAAALMAGCQDEPTSAPENRSSTGNAQALYHSCVKHGRNMNLIRPSTEGCPAQALQLYAENQGRDRHEVMPGLGAKVSRASPEGGVNVWDTLYRDHGYSKPQVFASINGETHLLYTTDNQMAYALTAAAWKKQHLHLGHGKYHVVDLDNPSAKLLGRLRAMSQTQARVRSSKYGGRLETVHVGGMPFTAVNLEDIALYSHLPKKHPYNRTGSTAPKRSDTKPKGKVSVCFTIETVLDRVSVGCNGELGDLKVDIARLPDPEHTAQSLEQLTTGEALPFNQDVLKHLLESQAITNNGSSFTIPPHLVNLRFDTAEKSMIYLTALLNNGIHGATPSLLVRK